MILITIRQKASQSAISTFHMKYLHAYSLLNEVTFILNDVYYIWWHCQIEFAHSHQSHKKL